MKDLCKAMGIEWHEFLTAKEATYPMECRCGRPLTKANHVNPDPTDPAFCWRALTYMLGREDWARFYHDMWYKYTMEQRAWTASGYIPWLLSDPAQFIELADEWCREHTEKGEQK